VHAPPAVAFLQVVGLKGAVVQHEDSELWGPPPELPGPVGHQSHGAHDQRGAVHSAPQQAVQKSDDLHCFPEAHLVAQDSPGALIVELPHPLHPRPLVVEELVPPLAP